MSTITTSSPWASSDPVESTNAAVICTLAPAAINATRPRRSSLIGKVTRASEPTSSTSATSLDDSLRRKYANVAPFRAPAETPTKTATKPETSVLAPNADDNSPVPPKNVDTNARFVNDSTAITCEPVPGSATGAEPAATPPAGSSAAPAGVSRSPPSPPPPKTSHARSGAPKAKAARYRALTATTAATPPLMTISKHYFGGSWLRSLAAHTRTGPNRPETARIGESCARFRWRRTVTTMKTDKNAAFGIRSLRLAPQRAMPRDQLAAAASATIMRGPCQRVALSAYFGAGTARWRKAAALEHRCCPPAMAAAAARENDTPATPGGVAGWAPHRRDPRDGNAPGWTQRRHARNTGGGVARRGDTAAVLVGLIAGAGARTWRDVAANPACPPAGLAVLADHPGTATELASREDVPTVALQRVYQSPNPRVKEAVARNRCCGRLVLRTAVAAQQPSLRAAAASNPATVAETLRALSFDPAPEVRAAAAGSAAMTVSLAHRLAAGETDVRAALAANPTAPAALVAELCRDASQPSVRAAAASNPACPQTAHNIACGDAAHVVRAAAARNPHCGRETLQRLAEDPHWGVWLAVVDNRRCPPETLLKLARHKHPTLRAAIAQHPSCPPRLKAALSKDPSWVVREAAAGADMGPGPGPAAALPVVPAAARRAAGPGGIRLQRSQRQPRGGPVPRPV